MKASARAVLVHLRKASLLPALALLLALLLGETASATTLYLSGFSNPVAPGSTVNVTVEADSYADLYAWQFDLSWNPSVLSLTGISEGTALQAAGTTYFVPGAIDNTSGTAIATADTLLGAVAGANGSNEALADFTFQAVDSGVSPLTIGNVILLDSNLDLIASDTLSGSLDVTNAPSPVPEPGSLPLLGTGLLLLVTLNLSKVRGFHLRAGAKLFSVIPVVLGLCMSHSTALGQACSNTLTITNQDGQPGTFIVAISGENPEEGSIPNGTSHSFDISYLGTGNDTVTLEATAGFSSFTISLTPDFVFSNGTQQVGGYIAHILNGGIATYQFSRSASTSSTCAPLTINTAKLPDAEPGAVYSQSLAASGGTPPYTWSVSSGALPTGFSLDPSTGRLIADGSDTVSDLYSFTVEVADAAKKTAQQSFTLLVNCSSSDTKDSDGDGLPDCWEKYGVYTNGARIDLPGMGANPNHKDVFVQYDWLYAVDHSHDPTGLLDPVVASFNNAPVDLDNSAGSGVTLHLIKGVGHPENSLDLAPSCTPFDWTTLQTYKSQAVLQQAPVLHYVLFAHNLAPGCDASGISSGIPSQDFIVSLGSPKSFVGPYYGLAVAGTFMHELGHNLGLHHGGVFSFSSSDPTTYKPNYLSVMNYWFQMTGLMKSVDGVVDLASADVLDYSRPSFLTGIRTLDEQHLYEGLGIGPGAVAGTTVYGTEWACKNNLSFDGTLDASKNVDWNCNGSQTDSDVAQVLRAEDSNAQDYKLLSAPASDWSYLVFKGGAIGALGASDTQFPILTAEETDELSRSQAMYLQQHSPFPRCPADLNEDGVVDQKDLDFVRAHLGTKYGDPNYDPNADYNHDGVIDVQDLAAVAKAQGCKSK